MKLNEEVTKMGWKTYINRMPSKIVDRPPILRLNSQVSCSEVEDHDRLAVSDEQSQKIDSRIICSVVDEAIRCSRPESHCDVVPENNSKYPSRDNG